MANLPVRVFALGAVSFLTLGAGEVGAPTLAKIIKIVCNSSGEAKVACPDPEVAFELVKLGIARDADARVAWALADKDVEKFAKLNKLVICGQISQIAQGASIAVVSEGGHPAIYISPSNAAACKMAIPDALLKMGKVVK